MCAQHPRLCGKSASNDLADVKKLWVLWGSFDVMDLACGVYSARGELVPEYR